MPIVAQRCLDLSEKLYKYGPGREIEVRFRELCYEMPQTLEISSSRHCMESVHL